MQCVSTRAANKGRRRPNLNKWLGVFIDSLTSLIYENKSRIKYLMLEKILDLFRDVDVWIVGRSLGEIFLIYMVVYIVLRIMQGPRGTTVLRGLAFIIVMISVVILFFVKKLQLLTIDWLVTEFVPVFIIPIIILFQPEFRRALLRLGQSPSLTYS